MKASALFALSLAVVSVSGDFRPGLRAKFDIFGKKGDEKFYDIPRCISAAVEQGWQLTERSDIPRASQVLYCPADPHLCGFYDPDTNIVTGLQICVPTSEFTNSCYDWSIQGYTKLTLPTQGEDVEYQCKAIYFVSDDFLSKTVDERLAIQSTENILPEGKLWLTGFNGNLDELPLKTTDIESTEIWTKQACVPHMGQHYYYKMSADTLCQADSLYSFFPLTDSGYAVGLGYIVFGKLPVTKSRRDWFERPPKMAVEFIVPSGPQCLYDLAGDPGVVTMHLYFIDNPENIGCPWSSYFDFSKIFKKQ